LLSTADFNGYTQVAVVAHAMKFDFVLAPLKCCALISKCTLVFLVSVFQKILLNLLYTL